MWLLIALTLALRFMLFVDPLMAEDLECRADAPPTPRAAVLPLALLESALKDAQTQEAQALAGYHELVGARLLLENLIAEATAARDGGRAVGGGAP